ncbi:hypothetical protein NDU88_002799 [Pleurodeles waltl]|uniref:Uncharacterized protein n=1 Tax=Pleurodeles waltl TaxID=8319 RepID=A0AAV7V0R5_PLEWA|nr:hypothetical protein NDU88_002799 [Pleurodeles waltl]
MPIITAGYYHGVHTPGSQAADRRLEGIDSTVSSLAAETKSICLDIAGFQSRVMGLEQLVIAVEDDVNTMPKRDQYLLFLCSKFNDLEHRSCRENSHFFGFPENMEGSDV